MRAFVNLHVFAEVSSASEANAIGSRISDTLKCFGDVLVTNVKQYWKIPEYFEFSVELSGASLSESDCPRIADILGQGWNDIGGNLIWNQESDAFLCDPKVRWANLEFIEIV
jgi:hypothetical protein